MMKLLDETLIDIDHKIGEIRKSINQGNIEQAYLAAETLKIKADDALHLVLRLSFFEY